MRYNYLIVAHILLSIVAHHLNDRWYYLMMSISWLIIPLYFILNRRNNFIILIWLAYSFNNVIDEILLSADYKTISEYIFAIFISISIFKMKCRPKK